MSCYIVIVGGALLLSLIGRLDKIQKIFPKIEHMFEKKKDEKTKKIHLVCIQAEEERKEQEKNRRLKSKAGKLGALKRWSTETLKEDD